MTRKILVLGASGFVGRQLWQRLGPARAMATYHRTAIDGGLPFDAVRMRLDDVIPNPQDISHAVLLLGDTRPDSCAVDAARSHALNVEGLQRAIDWCVARRITPLFASSEYVFDGRRGGYTEADPPSPTLTYGRQKVAVERYLAERAPRSVIFRLSKVYGTERGDGSLFTAWLDQIDRGETTIRCAADQVFSPVHVRDVVEGIIRLIEQDHQGLFHLAGPEGLSRIACLQRLLEQVGPARTAGVRVVPCSIDDIPLREPRPRDVSMKPDRLVAATGLRLTPVEEACRMLAAMSPQPA